MIIELDKNVYLAAGECTELFHYTTPMREYAMEFETIEEVKKALLVLLAKEQFPKARIIEDNYKEGTS